MVCGLLAPGTIDEKHRGTTADGYPFEPKPNGIGFVKLTLTRMRPIEGEPPVDASECPVCKSLYGVTSICEREHSGSGDRDDRGPDLDGCIQAVERRPYDDRAKQMGGAAEQDTQPRSAHRKWPRTNPKAGSGKWETHAARNFRCQIFSINTRLAPSL